MKSSVLALCAVTLAACSFSSPDNVQAPVATGLVVTDATRYDAHLVTGGKERVVFEVPFEIRNATGGPLYRIGCASAPPPTLEKRVGEEWVTAFAPVVNRCLSPPFEIAPGAVVRETLQVAGYLPGQGAAPEYRTEVEGTYRLNVLLYSSLTDEPFPLGNDLAPFEERVSNTFEVE